jgi:ribonuclease HI
VDPGFAEILRRERALLDPAVRGDPQATGSLLHPDFTEIGRSGRVWSRPEVLTALEADPRVDSGAEDPRAGAQAADTHVETGSETDAGEVSVEDARAVRLAEEVVLLTYRTGGLRPALRSSLWLHDPDSGWLLRFHQGTPAPSR